MKIIILDYSQICQRKGEKPQEKILEIKDVEDIPNILAKEFYSDTKDIILETENIRIFLKHTFYVCRAEKETETQIVPCSICKYNPSL